MFLLISYVLVFVGVLSSFLLLYDVVGMSVYVLFPMLFWSVVAVMIVVCVVVFRRVVGVVLCGRGCGCRVVATLL